MREAEVSRSVRHGGLGLLLHVTLCFACGALAAGLAAYVLHAVTH